VIDTNILKQLNHSDPEQRKKAVMDLAKTKDREALNYLAGVYRSDKDPEVRELARKAGLYINKHTDNGGGATKRKNDGIGLYSDDEDEDDAPKSKGTYYEEADSDVQDERIEVSELDKERAMGLVKQALDMHMRGNNDRAVKYLQDAFKKDPNLKRDSYTAGLATTITGLPIEEAIRYIASGDATSDGKKKRSVRDPEEPGWGDAIVDLLIYTLVNTGLVALALFVFVSVFLTGYSQAIAASASSGQFSSIPLPIDLSTFIASLAGISVPIVLLISAIVGFISTLGLLFQDFFIHMVSVTMLSGEGSMPRLITKTTVPLAFAYPIYYLIVLGITLYAAVNPDAVGLSAVLQFGLGVALTVWFSNRIGAAYRFGTGKGCAAIILSGIAIAAFSCVCSLVLPSLMVNAMTSGGF
jgi:hypothetical protein